MWWVAVGGLPGLQFHLRQPSWSGHHLDITDAAWLTFTYRTHARAGELVVERSAASFGPAASAWPAPALASLARRHEWLLTAILQRIGFVPREQYFPLGPRSRRLLRPGACFLTWPWPVMPPVRPPAHATTRPCLQPFRPAHAI